jgi:hypothetical protein
MVVFTERGWAESPLTTIKSVVVFTYHVPELEERVPGVGCVRMSA